MNAQRLKQFAITWLVTAKTYRPRPLYIALLVVPFVLLVGLLVRFAVNVPFWDQWELVTLFQKSGANTLGFADFFAQHNEHRIFFPRIVMFTLAKLTHWNTFYEVAFSVLVAGVAFVFLYKILERTFERWQVRLVAALLVSAVFFSPGQWENWLWGWQIQWFLTIAGLIMAVWALATWQARSPLHNILVAAAAAMLSTFSLASGFFVWVVCVPLIFCNKRLRPFLLLWLALAAAAFAAYYVGYHDPGGQPPKDLFLHEPRAFIHYFLVYIARPLVPDFLVSVRIAFIYLTVAGIALLHVFRKHRQQLTGSLLPWLCFGLYGLIAATTTSLSRLGYGIEQAYSSRYTTLSNFFLIAVVVIVCKLIELLLAERHPEKHTGVRGAYVVALVFAGLLVFVNYGKGVVQMRQQSAHLHKVQHCVHTARSEQDPCLLLAYPNQQIAWERLQYLRHIHYGGL